jgi:hypothetical protein
MYIIIVNHQYAMSVDGIYEGLKVFEKDGVDRSMLTNQSKKSLHRTEKKHGKLLGWSRGLKGHSDGDMLLNEEEARWQILFPAYKFGATILTTHPHVFFGSSIIALNFNGRPLTS